MNPITTKRPSAAMIVAGLALSLAVGGSALAGADAANKTLTKSKVSKIATKKAGKVLNQREAGLNVNSSKTAATAENAANAQNAATVGGVALAEVDYDAPNGTTGTTIFQGSGLTLTADCVNSVDLQIEATTSKEDASIHTAVASTDHDFADTMVTDDLENGGFDTNDSFDVLAQNPNDVESGLATFEYTAPDGSSVTGTILADEKSGACEANGHLMAS